MNKLQTKDIVSYDDSKMLAKLVYLGRVSFYHQPWGIGKAVQRVTAIYAAAFYAAISLFEMQHKSKDVGV